MNKFIFSIFTVSLILILSIITLPTTNALSIEESNLNGPVAPDTRINISIPIINDNNQKKMLQSF